MLASVKAERASEAECAMCSDDDDDNGDCQSLLVSPPSPTWLMGLLLRTSLTLSSPQSDLSPTPTDMTRTSLSEDDLLHVQ